jgi:hypothetical protein
MSAVRRVLRPHRFALGIIACYVALWTLMAHVTAHASLIDARGELDPRIALLALSVLGMRLITFFVVPPLVLYRLRRKNPKVAP